jgi:hypothetical protein
MLDRLNELRSGVDDPCYDLGLLMVGEFGRLAKLAGPACGRRQQVSPKRWRGINSAFKLLGRLYNRPTLQNACECPQNVERVSPRAIG